MVKSMTGFASAKGAAEGFTWAWDIRAVNARGLDVRLRLPDWVEGLEQAARSAVADVVTRGNVTMGLKLSRDETAPSEAVDPAALSRAMAQVALVQEAAAAAGVTLTAPSAADILSLRGVLSSAQAEVAPEVMLKHLAADLPGLVAAFDAMRRAEGAALKAVLEGQLTDIAALTEQAAALAEARKDQVAEKLQENLARVLQSAEGMDPSRLAQELALLAVKADVTEEIDRLRAHVKAARELLETKGAIGRKLDFLSQEFNREANTLCSKSQSAELTRVGLDLKATIDQMREQVQNVE